MGNNERVQWAEWYELGAGHEFRPRPDVTARVHEVKSVEAEGKYLTDRWTVHTTDGTGFAILAEHMRRPTANWLRERGIHPGDRVTVYTHNYSMLNGFDLNGRRLYLRSEREMNLDWLLFRASQRRKELEESNA